MMSIHVLFNGSFPCNLRLCSWLYLLPCLIGLFAPAASADSLRSLTKAAQVTRLAPDQAKLGYPVHLKGIVRYYDPQLPILNLQDDSGGIFVELAQPAPSLETGQWIELEGTTAMDGFRPIATNSHFRIIEAGTSPPAEKITLDQLDVSHRAAHWLEIQGIVQNAYHEGAYTVLETYEGNHKIYVRVRNVTQYLIDSVIGVQGVLAVNTDTAGRPIRLELWVPDERHIRIVSPPPLPIRGIPVTPIGTLHKNWKAGPPRHRIRVQGTVQPGNVEGSIIVKDATGILYANPLFTRPLLPGDDVELIGFADPESPSPRIINAFFLRIKAKALQSSEELGLPLLTSIADIRALSEREATRGYPVKVTGVITYHLPQLSMTFLQSGADAIYLNSLDPDLQLEENAEYEVQGFSAPGDFSPIITKPTFRRLRKSSPPKAEDVTLDQLSTGQFDSMRVRVEGVVQAIQQVGYRWRLDLFHKGRSIQLWVRHPESLKDLQVLQDAQIRATGVCSIQTGEWGNIVGFKLSIPSMADIQLVNPPQSDPFSIPSTAIRNLFRYSNTNGPVQRARVEGVLLYQEPGEFLYVRDNTGALAIAIEKSLPVNANDVLSISGYPVAGKVTASMQHALVRRIGTTTTPQPHAIASIQELSGNHHADLIEIRARLMDQWHGTEGHSYFLQDQATHPMTFEAYLENAHGNCTAPEMRNGSEVVLTGIVLLDTDGMKNRGVRLLLRAPEDIHIIKQAPWWTTRHTIWSIGLLLIAIVSALFWAGMLKRRVSQQTRVIKQRLEIEAALERQYRELFEGSNDIVFSCNSSGRFNSINPAAARILGYTVEELLALDPRCLISEASFASLNRCFQKHMRGEDCSVLECELKAKDGRAVIVEINGEIVFSNGHPVGAHGIARDITERKQTEAALRQSEERLRQAQKLEAIGNLAGGIAHDFNNILAAILGYAELTATDLPKEHPVASNISQIITAAKRARAVVQQILAFSHKLEHTRKPILLQPVLEEALHLLKATLPATIEIHRSIDPECAPVLADSTQIHQILLNLATNAGHAMKDSGGQLDIGLERIFNNGERPLPELPQGWYACLSVCDNGPGIDPEIQTQIFEPYFTTKGVGEGSGLGLAVVHGIVQSYGGLVRLQSSPGAGACFRIYLPCCEEKPSEVDTHSRSIVPGKGRILIVDDEEALVLLGSRLLKKLGYQVLAETDSLRALNVFSEDPHRFDLVITDQTMPHLTGIALAEAAWKLRPDIPIIISTGYSELITPEKTARTGAYALLHKPYTISALSQAVERCLSGEPSEPGLPSTDSAVSSYMTG